MLSRRLLDDEVRTGRVEGDGQIPDHSLDLNVCGRLPVPIVRLPRQVICRGRHELEMQLPTDLGSVRGERGCDMQWDRKDHLRLAESQTHLVVLGECCWLGFTHHWLLLRVCPRHLVHDLFATQRHRVLYTGNDSAGEV